MLKLHYKLKNAILALVDYFYPPFRRFLPAQTFRYAVCGGGNQAFNILLFTLFYHFVYHKDLAHMPFGFVLTPYVASFISAFCVTFPIGFYLNLFVVFPGSHLRRRVQLFRYFTILILNIFLNYGILKLFVEVFHWYPTPSYILMTVIVVSFTYFSQRYFSFRQQSAAALRAKTGEFDAVSTDQMATTDRPTGVNSMDQLN